MVQTLKEIYENLIPDTNKWSYYDLSEYPSPSLNYNTLNNNEESYEFIKSYFAHGGKKALFDDSYLNENSEIIKTRAPHVISTYLLGIIIAEYFNFDLNSLGCNNINFKYLWFLACLYHDIGYIYEEKYCCSYLRMLQENGLDAIKEICNIKYLHNREFITYSKDCVNLYLSSRAKCSDSSSGKIDHGIVGGLLLYDRLRKNFETAWKKTYKQKPTASRTAFTCDELDFSNRHYAYYAKAADAIISHNIWLETLNEYLLQNGELPQKKQIIKKRNLIAFILAIADTIEPIKKFGFNSLSKVKCEKLADNGFKLLMPNSDNDNSYNYITELPKWVDVNVTKEENNIFLITN